MNIEDLVRNQGVPAYLQPAGPADAVAHPRALERLPPIVAEAVQVLADLMRSAKDEEVRRKCARSIIRLALERPTASKTPPAVPAGPAAGGV